MSKSARSKAEAHFSATEKKSAQELKEREKARLERTEQVARLRALRLAKEAETKAAAALTEPADKAETKAAASPRLPQVHRTPS